MRNKLAIAAILALLAVPLYAQTIRPTRISQIQWTSLTTAQEAGMTLAEGSFWYNSDLKCYRYRSASSTYCITGQEANPGLWNGIRVVDGNKFTTIQAASDDLAGPGLVIVPSSYAGAEITTLPTDYMILDLRQDGRIWIRNDSVPAVLQSLGLFDYRGVYRTAQTVDDPMVVLIRTQDAAGNGNMFRTLGITLDTKSTATGSAGAALRMVAFQAADEETTGLFSDGRWQGTSDLDVAKRIFGVDAGVVVDSVTFSNASAIGVLSRTSVIGANTGREVFAFWASNNNTGDSRAAYYVGAPPTSGKYDYGLDLKDHAFNNAAIRLRAGGKVVRRNAADSADSDVFTVSDTITNIIGGTDVRLQSGGTLMAGVNANGFFVSSGQKLQARIVNPLEGTLSNVPRWIFKQVDFGDMTAGATADTFTLWTLPANSMIHDVVGTVVTGWSGGSISAAVCSVGTNGGSANDLALDDNFFAAATRYELHDATASGGKGTLLFDTTDKFAPYMAVAAATIEIQCDLTGDNHANATAGQARIYILVSQPLANTTIEAN